VSALLACIYATRHSKLRVNFRVKLRVKSKVKSKVDSWFKCNKLSLNISKTNFILFNSNKKLPILRNTPLCLIKINGQVIKSVYSTKFLGVLIDDSLGFKCHIDYLVNKLSKYVGLFYKIRHFLPLSALMMLYKTLFEPHLNY